jgi:hypothetical protein
MSFFRSGFYTCQLISQPGFFTSLSDSGTRHQVQGRSILLRGPDNTVPVLLSLAFGEEFIFKKNLTSKCLYKLSERVKLTN